MKKIKFSKRILLAVTLLVTGRIPTYRALASDFEISSVHRGRAFKKPLDRLENATIARINGERPAVIQKKYGINKSELRSFMGSKYGSEFVDREIKKRKKTLAIMRVPLSPQKTHS